MEDYRNAFSLFDKNEDGTVTTKDLGTLCQACGLIVVNSQLDAFLQTRDDEPISFPEFLTLAAAFHAIRDPDSD